MKMPLFILMSFIVFGCASREEKELELTKEAESVKTASAKVHSFTNKKINGTVTFKEEKGNIIVTPDISGLKANTKLGFHVHEKGVCEGPGYKSAGDHYNPSKTSHGSPDGKSHSGDMGNIMTDKNGKSMTSVTLHGVSLDELIGKSVLIHAKADDLKSQPAGNSGSRIACGLIRPIE